MDIIILYNRLTKWSKYHVSESYREDFVQSTIISRLENPNRTTHFKYLLSDYLRKTNGSTNPNRVKHPRKRGNRIHLSIAPRERDVSESQGMVVFEDELVNGEECRDRCGLEFSSTSIRTDLQQEFLRYIKGRKRVIIKRLDAGYTPTEIAEHFRLHPSRISQIKREIRKDMTWLKDSETLLEQLNIPLEVRQWAIKHRKL